MALTENGINTKQTFRYRDLPLAAGAITVFDAAILNVNAAGYGKLASDTAGEKFAGVAVAGAYTVQATGGAAGDNEVKVLAAKSMETVKLKLTGVAIVDVLTDAMASADDAVVLAATATNDIRVGTIVALAQETDYCWVILD